MIFKLRDNVEKLGTPSGKKGEGLNRGLAPGDDARHYVKGPFRYEWWYFDAVFDNGYSAVAIIWPMNYAKPWRKQCTVMLSIYTPDGDTIKHYLFPPRRLFQASYTHCDVRVGENYLRGIHPRYEIHLEAGEEMADLVFEAETPGWKPGAAVNYTPFPRYRSMGWLVPLPRARVHGVLRVGGRELAVKGRGYHDHNWGETPFTHMVDNWHWGHIASGDLGIIWADITMDRTLGYDRFFAFLLSRENHLVYESADLKVSYEDWRDDPAYPYPYAGKISVSFGLEGDEARGELTMHVRDIVEIQDLMEVSGLPSLLLRFIHATLAWPFYFRWRSSVEGWVEIEGERIPLEGDTVHEQMFLHSRLYRGVSPPHSI